MCVGFTPHPNPPPQGGRGILRQRGRSLSPLEGEGWEGGAA
jgi:hypothetical protein